jgi:DNA processing protein
MWDTTTKSCEGALTLLALPGVGAKSARALAETYETLEDVKAAAEQQRSGVLRRTPPSLTDPSAWQAAHVTARQTQEKADEFGTRILTLFDPCFPELLRTIPDAPLVLYVKGRLPEGRRSVACIGTREPSEFGCVAAKRITNCLATHGWSIVSGLAIGVDTHAHREALAANAHTVAVLANGLDKVYPRENAKLASEILEKGGALVSEQTFGAPAAGSNLVQRDRLQCGMSVATFVMQTDIVGGSMHTVRFTLLQHRLLFAPVPTGSHANEEKSRGIVALTSQNGSALVSSLRNPTPEYATLLRTTFHSRPPARPIHSRADYASVLAELEAALTSPSTTNPDQSPADQQTVSAGGASSQPGIF